MAGGPAQTLHPRQPLSFQFSIFTFQLSIFNLHIPRLSRLPLWWSKLSPAHYLAFRWHGELRGGLNSGGHLW